MAGLEGGRAVRGGFGAATDGAVTGLEGARRNLRGGLEEAVAAARPREEEARAAFTAAYFYIQY